MVSHGADPVADSLRHLAHQLLRRHIQFMDVVVHVMEEIAHFVVRGRIGQCTGALQRVVQFGELFARTAQCLVHRDESTADRRRVLDNQFQILCRGVLAGKQRIGKGFGEVGENPVLIVFRQ